MRQRLEHAAAFALGGIMAAGLVVVGLAGWVAIVALPDIREDVER